MKRVKLEIVKVSDEYIIRDAEWTSEEYARTGIKELAEPLKEAVDKYLNGE